MYNTDLKNFWMFKLIVEGVKKVSVVFSDLNFWIEIEIFEQFLRLAPVGLVIMWYSSLRQSLH